MENSARAQPHNYKTEVREQYEDFPYPSRDIDKELQFYHGNDAQSLVALNHIGWGGRRNLRDKTRILIAGCGTGDSVVAMAEELYGSDAEIIGIDLSARSLEIATARLKKRGLTNARLIHLSLLDAPNAGLGQFDVIECGGVLHHLPDPALGLAALKAMLKDDGVMALMVYGQYGRLSIYLVQKLMRKLIPAGMPRAERIAMVREFLNHVPSEHWLTVNNAGFLEDLNWPDGSGIYDLFLHSTDRAYTVPQIYDWVEGQGLQLLNFYSPTTDESLYTPDCYTPSAPLRRLFASQSPRERHATAELMHGNIGKHFFYVAKEAKEPAQFAEDMVMEFGPMQGMFMEFKQAFLNALRTAPIGQRVEGKAQPLAHVPSLFITKTPHVEWLLQAIDGVRSIGEMLDQLQKTTGANRADLRLQLEMLYKELRSRQVVFLRHASIPAYRTGQEILARIRTIQKGQ